MTIEQIETMIAGRADGGNNTVLTERALWTAFKNEFFKIKEVKELDVNLTSDPAFLVDNFDSSGLGINEYEGWAICNGNNGTRNRKGRVAIGYDSVNYPTPGATGGEKNHVLTTAEVPALTVPIPYDSPRTAPPGGSEKTISNNPGAPTGVVNVTTNGGGGAHNNMQPYIVTLFIQRVA